MKPAMNMKILIPEVDIVMTQGGLTTQDSSPNSVTSPRSTMQLLKMETANEWEWKVQHATLLICTHLLVILLSNYILLSIDYRAIIIMSDRYFSIETYYRINLNL